MMGCGWWNAALGGLTGLYLDTSPCFMSLTAAEHTREQSHGCAMN